MELGILRPVFSVARERSEEKRKREPGVVSVRLFGARVVQGNAMLCFTLLRLVAAEGEMSA
jgi:hypothetical protein